ncbi:MAG: antibiotic biosynthesis monooxygenase [Bacteroidota bacterium]
MYVHVVSFKIKKGEEITFVELQKFEENMEAKPAGLDHFHIYKDRNDHSRYFLVEYWDSKEDKVSLEETDDHKYFHKLRRLAIEKKYETFECDLVV